MSVLYVYDIEAMEPVCAEVFPGNSMDAISYAAFIRDNDKGILVADKGFPPSQIRNELGERPDLYFLTPIKRNDKRIFNNIVQRIGILIDNYVSILRESLEIAHGRNRLCTRETIFRCNL